MNTRDYLVVALAADALTAREALAGGAHARALAIRLEQCLCGHQFGRASALRARILAAFMRF